MKSIAINQFFNPEDEEVDDNLEVIVNGIAKADSAGDGTYEIDEKDIVILGFGYFETMKSLQKLWLYEKQQKKEDSELISQIN